MSAPDCAMDYSHCVDRQLVDGDAARCEHGARDDYDDGPTCKKCGHELETPRAGWRTAPRVPPGNLESCTECGYNELSCPTCRYFVWWESGMRSDEREDFARHRCGDHRSSPGAALVPALPTRDPDTPPW